MKPNHPAAKLVQRSERTSKFTDPLSFINTDFTTPPPSMSTNFSLTPPAFAQGFGLARQAYAAGNAAPSSGSSFRCQAARAVANATRRATDAIGLSYLMLNRVLTQWFLGSIRGVGGESLSVSQTFVSDAPNAINTLYYRYVSKKGFADHGGIANFFVITTDIQRGFLNSMLQSTSLNKVKVKELAAGGRLDRWEIIKQYIPPNRSLDVTITDFSTSIIPENKLASVRSDSLAIHLEEENLFEPLQELNQEDRFDTILTRMDLTLYGFR